MLLPGRQSGRLRGPRRTRTVSPHDGDQRGPFFLNTLVAVAAFAGLALSLPADGSLEGVGYAGGVLGWLGLSFGLHAFPSTGDATSLWNQTKSRWRQSPSALLGLPVILLISVVNLLGRFWLDLLYAVALFVLVTELLVSAPIG